MINEHNIPKVFQSSDIVYHYCDSNTAIQYILHEKRLRLSSRKNSIDPIENKKPFISYLQTENFDDDTKASTNRVKIRDLTLEKLGNAKQLCLCKNDESKYHSDTNPQYPYEYYGFLKPRMWDQYANKYQGICLAFSFNALKKNASDFKNGEIKYVNYNRFKLRHKSINVNEVEKMGTEKYWELESKRIEKDLFEKHLDYKDENEYRFISFSNKEFDYVDIEKCLRGIIVTASINEFQLEAVTKYAQEYSAALVFINWESTGLELSTKDELDKIVSLFSKTIHSLNNKKIKKRDNSQDFTSSSR